MNRLREGSRAASAWLVWVVWLSILILLAPFVARAAGADGVLPVPPLTGRVVDQTSTLTAPQVQALDSKLAAIEASRGSQIVVLIVPTTVPEDITSYAQRVGDQWKVGRREVGDGVIVVVAKDDRKVRIHVAKTLQGAIPDVIAGRIINEQMVPAFRNGDYAGGLNVAVDLLDKRIAGEGLPAPSGSSSNEAPRPNASNSRSSGFDLQDIAIFLFVGVPIVGGLLSRVFGRKLGALATGGAAGAIGWWLTASVLAAGAAGVIALFLVGVIGMGSGRRGIGPVIWGGGFGGGGSFGGGSGGGFSSGGGGNFDGGGASGSW